MTQRDWNEVKISIDDVAKANPESAVPLILRAASYEAQDKYMEAQIELKKARLRFPKDVAVRCARPT